jgi:hypothetical protein
MMNFTSRRNGAKLADDQLVANEIEVVEHIALEVFRVLKIVVIGVVPHHNIGVGEDVFQIHQPGLARNRMAAGGVRSMH